MDADDVRAVDERAEHLALLEIGGDEHVAFQTRAGGVGGDGVGEIAGGGAGHDFETRARARGSARRRRRDL